MKLFIYFQNSFDTDIKGGPIVFVNPRVMLRVNCSNLFMYCKLYGSIDGCCPLT